MSTQVKKLLRRLVLFLVIGCIIPGGLLLAQTPVVKTSVDRTSILIGEQIRYRIEISFPVNSYKIQWFDIPAEKNHFEVVSKDEVDSSSNGSATTFGQTIIFTNFDSGKQVIPAFPIGLTEINGTKKYTIYTDSIAVSVLHSPLDSVQPFHDIKPIIETKDTASDSWWIWALAALVLILIAIYFLRKKKGKKEASEMFTSPVPPYEEAMDAIRNLEQEKLLLHGDQKEFHLRLSEIFKRYLTRKTRAGKMHFTTGDLMTDTCLTNLAKSSHEKIAIALRMGDAVKFAKYSPSVQDSEWCRDAVRDAVTEIHSQTTKPDTHDR